MVATLSILFALIASPAFAHPGGQKPVAFLRAEGTRIVTLWTAAPDEMQVLAAALDLTDVPERELVKEPAFQRYFAERFVVETAGRPCPTVADAVTTSPSAIGVVLSSDCAPALEAVTLRITLLLDISKDYFHLVVANTLDGGTVRGAFTQGSSPMIVDFERGRGTQAAPDPETQEEPAEGRGTGRIVAALQGQAGAVPLAVALLLAFFIGLLHAFTPGHGKTITAAYLVGSRGTIRQAVTLGAITTATHAAAVALLGGIAVGLNKTLLPTESGPWLEIGAGALVLGLGASLLRAALAGRSHSHAHGHDHPDGEHHDHGPDRAGMRLTARRLALLGLVGGLIPSPEAISIALVAFSLGRWTAGVALIVAFSLGLAVVLIGIAIAAVRGGALLSRYSGGRLALWAPRLASVAFIGMGTLLAVRGATRL